MVKITTSGQLVVIFQSDHCTQSAVIVTFQNKLGNRVYLSAWSTLCHTSCSRLYTASECDAHINVLYTTLSAQGYMLLLSDAYVSVM